MASNSSMDALLSYTTIILAISLAIHACIQISPAVSTFFVRSKPGSKISTYYLLHLITIVLLLLLMMNLCFGDTKKLDQSILLEKKHSTYWKTFVRARTTLATSPDSTDYYASTGVDKDGFADITYEDLKRHLTRVRYTYPDATCALLRFTDGTGLRIPLHDQSLSIYGMLDENGEIIPERSIDLSIPLAEQIAGLSSIKYMYNDQGNPVHEIHLDSNGNAVADANGVAEYYREYDTRGHIIWEMRIRPDGTPCLNASGSAEFRREYNGDNLIRETFYDGEGNPICLSDALYSSRTILYDEWNNCIREDYFDEQGNPVIINKGYSSVWREYNAYGQLLHEGYLDTNGLPINIDIGYSEYQNEYLDNGNLSLTYYYDSDGNILECGSSYLHKYLQTIKDYDVIFISIKDEGTLGLTETLLKDLAHVGVTTDLTDKARWSFYAILAEGVDIENVAQAQIEYSGMINSNTYSIVSAGWPYGNISSIIINGTEYSKNVRGMNIVTINDNEVSSISFDTCTQTMKVTK